MATEVSQRQSDYKVDKCNYYVPGWWKDYVDKDLQKKIKTFRKDK